VCPGFPGLFLKKDKKERKQQEEQRNEPEITPNGIDSLCQMHWRKVNQSAE
jgi:hypothetical protein